MRNYNLTWDEVGQLEYKKALTMFEMCGVSKALESGAKPDTLLSSFEQYEINKPLYDRILKARDKRRGRPNS